VDQEAELAWIGERSAEVLGVSRAEIELGRARADRTDAPTPLEVDGRRVGTIYTPVEASPNAAVRNRFLSAADGLPFRIAAARDANASGRRERRVRGARRALGRRRSGTDPDARARTSAGAGSLRDPSWEPSVTSSVNNSAF